MNHFSRGRYIAYAVFALVVALFAFPLVSGFVTALFISLYHFPALGEHGFSLQGFGELFSYPNLWRSVLLTCTIGLGATLLSFGIVILLCMHSDILSRPRSHKLVSLFLSVPHSAFAIGFLFLVLPNGWLLRLLSPWLTGFDRPPSGWYLPDLYGFTAIIGLALKEVPFLLLVWVAAERQFKSEKFLHNAYALGYTRQTAWLKAVFPQIYGRARLCVFAVLAYSLSVVDVALILSPSPTPVLSVLVLRWSQDADIAKQFLSASAAMLQFAVILSGFLMWWFGEVVIKILYRRAIFKGKRHLSGASLYRFGGDVFKFGVFGMCCVAILALPLFSFASRWRFPSFIPDKFSLSHWVRAMDSLLVAFWDTAILGFFAAVLGLVVAVLLLEIKSRYRASIFLPSAEKLLYLPLLIPQTAFLYGVQIFLLKSSLFEYSLGVFIAVLVCHLLFVLPYILLVLGDIYGAYDRRYSIVGECLGRSSLRVFFRVKLGLLLSPLLLAFAVGFAVSVGQYLPTIFASAGRFSTLTTEAVTLAAGGNRGTLASYAVLQSLLPLFVFLVIFGYRGRVERQL